MYRPPINCCLAGQASQPAQSLLLDKLCHLSSQNPLGRTQVSVKPLTTASYKHASLTPGLGQNLQSETDYCSPAVMLQLAAY